MYFISISLRLLPQNPQKLKSLDPMNTTNNRIANDIAHLIRPSLLLFNGLILFLLSSCGVTSGSGSFNSSGQAHGPWTIYERFGDGPARVLARGSLVNGQPDGAWKGYQSLTLQSTFRDGVPHGPFVVSMMGQGDGKLMDTAFDYRNGQISGTIELPIWGSVQYPGLR